MNDEMTWQVHEGPRPADARIVLAETRTADEGPSAELRVGCLDSDTFEVVLKQTKEFAVGEVMTSINRAGWLPSFPGKWWPDAEDSRLLRLARQDAPAFLAFLLIDPSQLTVKLDGSELCFTPRGTSTAARRLACLSSKIDP